MYPKYEALLDAIRKLDDGSIFYQKTIMENDIFLLCSNDFDGDTLNIICRHLQELGEFLYTEEHVQLIARQEHNRDFCIYVAPFEEFADLDEVMKLIEDFVERKREEEENNKNYNLPTERIIPELKLLNQKIDEMKDQHQNLIELLKKMQSELDESRENEEKLLKQLEERKLEIGVLIEKSKYFQRNESEQKSGWTKFYDQTDFSLLRENPILMKSASHDVSMIIDDQNKWTMEEKVEKLTVLMDVLQTNMSDMSKLSQEKQFLKSMNAGKVGKHISKICSSEIPGILRKYKEEYNLKDVGGTVHFLPITFLNKQQYLCMAICEHRIMVFSTGEKEKDCLYGVAKVSNKLKCSFKLATRVNLPMFSSLHDNFVMTRNDKVYEEHDRVIKWIQNNFKCLEYGINDELVHQGIIYLNNIFHHSFLKAM